MGLVAAVLSAPIIGYLAWHEHSTGEHALILLEHAVLEYADFIVLLASLYIVAGGIVLEGQLRASALTNTLLLAVGAVIANFIGTTGASMLLIKPFLRINATRHRNRHSQRRRLQCGNRRQRVGEDHVERDGPRRWHRCRRRK